MESPLAYQSTGQSRNGACRIKMAVIIAIFALIPFYGCTTCRVTSVEDANKYARSGYETRIAVYKTGLDGLLWGAFMWTHHAQAQVYVGNEWKWVETLGLSDSPTFSIADNEIYYWRATDYASFLKKSNRYY